MVDSNSIATYYNNVNRKCQMFHVKHLQKEKIKGII